YANSCRILDDRATLWLYDRPITRAASQRLSLTKRHKTSRLRGPLCVFCAVERPSLSTLIAFRPGLAPLICQAFICLKVRGKPHPCFGEVGPCLSCFRGSCRLRHPHTIQSVLTALTRVHHSLLSWRR